MKCRLSLPRLTKPLPLRKFKTLMSMAEINAESEPKFLPPETDTLPASKRMPDTDSLDEDEAERERKRQKPVGASDPVPEAPEGASDGDERDKDEEPAADPNGISKGKGALTAADKGKGILVEDEEEEDEEDDGDDDDDSDDSSDVDSRDEIGGEGDDDSDFVDDPLAEVDLDNILPSRTRRREAPPPGAYFDPHQDEDDSDDSE